MNRHTGNRADLDKKPDDVATMFDEVAERYDLTNDVLSMGQTVRWRKKLVEALAVQPGEKGAGPRRRNGLPPSRSTGPGRPRWPVTFPWACSKWASAGIRS